MWVNCRLINVIGEMLFKKITFTSGADNRCRLETDLGKIAAEVLYFDGTGFGCVALQSKKCQ